MEQLPIRIFRCRKMDDENREVAMEIGDLREAVRRGIYTGADQIWDEESSTWLSLKTHSATASLFSQTLWDAWDESSSFNMISDLRARKVTPQNEASAADETFQEAFNSDQEPSPLTDDILDLDARDIELLGNEGVDENIIALSDEDLQPLPIPSSARKFSPKPRQKKAILPIEAAIFGLSEPPEFNPTLSTTQSNTPLSPKLDRRSAEALSEMMLPPRRSPKARKSNRFYGFSWMRIVLIILPLSLVGWAYVSVINLEVAKPYADEMPAPKTQSPPTEMETMERAIREQLPSKIQKVSLDKSFENALLIDMSVMNINVIDLNAPIKQWRGRRLDEPKRGAVQLRIQSRGESARELSVIAMIVGKYMRAYNMEIDSIDVTFDEGDTAFKQSISPVMASKFFLKRIDMTQFLNAQLGNVD